MCTVTWRYTSAGYEVVSSRDIDASRAAAEPPRVHLLRQVRALAPVERVSGGAWLGVNEHGVTLAILNEWPAPARAGTTSRGQVLLDALHATSARQALELVAGADLSEVSPFKLLAIDEEGPGLIRWYPGEQVRWLPVAPGVPIVTSSSRDTERVIASRVAQLERQGAPRSSAEHLGFHVTHTPGRGPDSICLHREDARTVGLGWVRVAGRQVRLDYRPGSPCQDSTWHRTLLSPSPHPWSAA